MHKRSRKVLKPRSRLNKIDDARWLAHPPRIITLVAVGSVKSIER
jgi:hypothetical protein